jgi:hypothetical protein
MDTQRVTAVGAATTRWVIARAECGEWPFEYTEPSMLDTAAVERVRVAAQHRDVRGLAMVIVATTAVWIAALALPALLGG